MTDDALLAIVERLDETRLLVLGDLRLERILRGEAVPGAGSTVMMCPAERITRAGGAGAIACAAAAMGARVWAAGVLGRDAQSGELLRALGEAGVDAFGVVTAPAAHTAETSVVELGSAAAAPWSRIEIELAPPPPVEGAAAHEMLGHIEALIAQADALVIVTPKSAAQDVLARVAEFARSKGKAVIGAHVGGWLPPCDLVVLGPSALGERAGDHPQADSHLIGRLLAEGGHRAAVAPCSPRGVIVYRQGPAPASPSGPDVTQTGFELPGQPVAGPDVSGQPAWVHLVAGAAVATAAGADEVAAARTGVACARAAETQLPVTREAIQLALSGE